MKTIRNANETIRNANETIRCENDTFRYRNDVLLIKLIFNSETFKSDLHLCDSKEFKRKPLIDFNSIWLRKKYSIVWLEI